MKKLIAAFFLLASLSLLSLPASAETLTLVSTGGQVVNGEYIYPYNFSINGSSALTSMMCLDFTRQITFGETWNVTPSGLSLDNSQLAIDYRALALILYGAEHQSFGLSLSDYQYAAWSIFDPIGILSYSAYTPTAQLISSEALQYANGGNVSSLLPGFSYSNFALLSPTSDTTGWTAGTPQRFLENCPPPTATTPEPSNLLLLGTGVIGIAGILRQRLVRV